MYLSLVVCLKKRCFSCFIVLKVGVYMKKCYQPTFFNDILIYLNLREAVTNKWLLTDSINIRKLKQGLQ